MRRQRRRACQVGQRRLAGRLVLRLCSPQHHQCTCICTRPLHACTCRSLQGNHRCEGLADCVDAAHAGHWGTADQRASADAQRGGPRTRKPAKPSMARRPAQTATRCQRAAWQAATWQTRQGQRPILEGCGCVGYRSSSERHNYVGCGASLHAQGSPFLISFVFSSARLPLEKPSGSKMPAAHAPLLVRRCHFR